MPNGRTLRLTSRDIEIFVLLNQYRYLRSTFIHAFVGGQSAKRFKERLCALYHDGGYVDRPAQQWQFANARYMPVVYENAAGAEEILRQVGRLGDERRSFLLTARGGAHRQFAHSLMICDVLASIELGARATQGLRFVSWQEILAKAPAETHGSDNPFGIKVSISNARRVGAASVRADVNIIPDGIFGLEYMRHGKREYRFFALEADRNTVPVARSDLVQSSYFKKVLAYREIVSQGLQKSRLGLPNLLVLNVTTNEQHMRNIMALVQELTGGSTLFLFKMMSSAGDFAAAPVPSPDLLCTPWERAGFPPLAIGEV